MICFRHVSKSYQTRILQEIDLVVQPGEIFGIIGLSGAGKSTLLKLLNGLEREFSGSITLFGEELQGLSNKKWQKLRGLFGMVFQHFNLFPSRTLFENIAYPLEIQGKSKEEIKNRVDHLLSLVRLEHKQKLYPSMLSGGEKQRAGIARALATAPKLLLLDEATSALDPESTKEILALLKEIHQKEQITILLITHEMDVIKTLCHKVAVLDQGKIVEQGSVREIFTAPSHPLTKKFFESSTHHLPLSLQEKRLFKLSFQGHSAKEPVISMLLKRSQVHINILLGDIDCIDSQIVGHLVIELMGTEKDKEEALLFLKEQEVRIEAL
jgi:D-methionine transport system ATP-binding protein